MQPSVKQISKMHTAQHINANGWHNPAEMTEVSSFKKNTAMQLISLSPAMILSPITAEKLSLVHYNGQSHRFCNWALWNSGSLLDLDHLLYKQKNKEIITSNHLHRNQLTTSGLHFQMVWSKITLANYSLNAI